MTPATCMHSRCKAVATWQIDGAVASKGRLLPHYSCDKHAPARVMKDHGDMTIHRLYDGQPVAQCNDEAAQIAEALRRIAWMVAR